jgi:hypothetical protein
MKMKFLLILVSGFSAHGLEREVPLNDDLDLVPRDMLMELPHEEAIEFQRILAQRLHQYSEQRTIILNKRYEEMNSDFFKHP